MSLTADQIDRYKRHILLPEIGGQGQQKLRRAKILVVGAGGIGCPLLSYLAAAGIGEITIIDPDTVDISNLQRQTLYKSADIGKPKADIAAQALSELNPDTQAIPVVEKLSAHNIDDMVSGCDLVAEGVDNFETRFALNAAAIRHEKTLVSAAIGRFDGQISVFKAWSSPEQPCYQCLVPNTPTEFADCETEGVAGPVPGVVGSLAALEVLKEIAGFGTPLAGHLLLYSALTGETRRIRLLRDPACPAHT